MTEPILRLFLLLKLQHHKEGDIRKIEDYEFTIGQKNENGGFHYDNRLDLEYLFKDEKLNIINKLEFINNFEMS